MHFLLLTCHWAKCYLHCNMCHTNSYMYVILDKLTLMSGNSAFMVQKIELTTNVASPQGIITPPRHLVLFLVSVGVCVCPAVSLICNSYLISGTSDHCLLS
jgi:hypothetical protein